MIYCSYFEIVKHTANIHTKQLYEWTYKDEGGDMDQDVWSIDVRFHIFCLLHLVSTLSGRAQKPYPSIGWSYIQFVCVVVMFFFSRLFSLFLSIYIYIYIKLSHTIFIKRRSTLIAKSTHHPKCNHYTHIFWIYLYHIR